jgi:ribonuclease Z
MHPPGKAEIVPNHEKDRPFPTNDKDISHARTKMLSEMRDFAEACTAARHSAFQDPRYHTPPRFSGDDIVVTTLGTGSAIPSKYRNVSATHLDIPGTGGVLLDCGEGTLGQLRRRFGPVGLREVYGKLKLIFISHMHADHHLGLQAVLEDRFNVSMRPYGERLTAYQHGFEVPLYIIAPSRIATALKETATWQQPASEEALENVMFLNTARLSARPLYASHDVYGRQHAEAASQDDQVPGSPPADNIPAAAPAQHVAEDILKGARRWPSEDVLGWSPVV